ncbi:TetR/AcrR family transcriptional regulator [Mycolicibacterium grossiae]|uniref:TetR family transcriptional regulator n=1 Tax=Mycolicibacterium grossiae TaxID=1552759 RepID=A0A1E8PYB7_9MYCO|nr:TetR/AcrR family transcriptional regulator [Mycolicibacterium grossiae]OFJ51293.1 TetR family transcriptional regulator [Mycolicibacterium grossiae]QEM47442.1 TetR/AcrR family transcriptional regulator [Mycolicibacterium grossiae]
MASDRRIGGPDAKNRGVLLDAAEQLMLEEGYAAVTSRRVADRAGLKPQLVHYYFRTMDDLFIEVFRRMSQLGLQAHGAVLDSPQPLWAMWEFGMDPHVARLTMEFMGLANHRKALRAEIARFADQFRQQQVEVLTVALRRHGQDASDVPPVVWAVYATSVSRVLALEDSLGISFGHTEMQAFCEQWLRELEGERVPLPSATSA